MSIAVRLPGQAGHAGLVPGKAIWVADRTLSVPAGLREKTGVAIPGMEIGQMHRLGNRLVELAAEATGTPGDIALTQGETAVLEDAVEHPGSSVSMIHERTGFAQTHVSESVVRLKERGLLATAGDSPYKGLASAWRSGTRVRPTAEALKAISRRQARRVDEAVVHAVADPSEAGRAIALMDELAAILL